MQKAELPDAVISDFNGLRIDNDYAWRQAGVDLMAEYDVVVPPELFEYLHDKPLALGSEIFYRLIAPQRRPPLPEFSRALRDRGGQYTREHAKLKPGAAALLQGLAAAGVPLGLATRSPLQDVERASEAPAIRRELGGLDLRSYFVSMATCEDVPTDRLKPRGDLVWLALDRMSEGGLEPRKYRTVVLDDRSRNASAALFDQKYGCAWQVVGPDTGPFRAPLVLHASTLERVTVRSLGEVARQRAAYGEAVESWARTPVPTREALSPVSPLREMPRAPMTRPAAPGRV